MRLLKNREYLNNLFLYYYSKEKKSLTILKYIKKISQENF
jgi:hypothetical protein